MKILSIGDIHGIDVIDDIKSKINDYDKIVFVGDYVDSFDISDNNILSNLMNIIELKIQNPDKVILLWGNHDIQYLMGYSRYGCTGYRPSMYPTLKVIFNNNAKLFQNAYQYDNYIWTHAGIHQGWFKYRFKGDQATNIADQLNKEGWNKNETLFDVGHRRGGYYDVGGIFWCDRVELMSSPLKGYHQIVGHTARERIEKIYVKNCELNFIDILRKEIKFHEKIIVDRV